MFKLLSLIWGLKILFWVGIYSSIFWQPQTQPFAYSHMQESHTEAQVKWTQHSCHYFPFCVHKLKYHNLIPSHLNPVQLNLSLTVNLKVTSINPSLTLSKLRNPTLFVCLQNFKSYYRIHFTSNMTNKTYNFIFEDSLGCQLLWSFPRVCRSCIFAVKLLGVQ